MRLSLCIVLATSLVAAPAHADEPSPKPWERGTTDTQREEALVLFRQGNQHFSAKEYRRAAASYEGALAVWDHPRIHGNLGTTLIYLRAPVKALEHIERALRYGATPFEEHVFQQLTTQQRLLRDQLATLSVACAEVGAEVVIDGEPQAACPMDARVTVVAGEHIVLARQPGHLTFTRKVTVLPGRVATVRVVMIDLDDAARVERRWATWKPWVVVGAGLAVAAVGVPFQRASIANRNRYEQEVAEQCERGCAPETLPASTHDLVGRSRTFNALAISSFAVGGATVASGLVLVYMNRAQRVLLDEDGDRMSMVPVVGPYGAGLTIQGRF